MLLLKCELHWGYLMLILTDGQFDDMATIRKSLKNSTIMVLSEDCKRNMGRYEKVAKL